MNDTQRLFLFLFLMVAAALIHQTVTMLKNRRQAEQQAKAAYGTAPPDRGGMKKYMRDYHHYAADRAESKDRIDAITWNDLNMDEVYLRINACSSSCGEEVLYHLLHETETRETLLQRESLIRWMQEEEADRLRMQRILLGIGHRNHSGFSFYLFHAASKKIGSPRQYIVQGLLPLATLLIVPFSPMIGLSAFVFTALANILTYYQKRSTMEYELDAMRYFSALLYAARSMQRRFGERLKALDMDPAGPLAPFRRTGGLIPGQAQGVAGGLEALTAYPKAIFLWDLITYNHTVRQLDRYQEEARRIFLITGLVDSAISAASFRESLPVCCRPEFSHTHEIRFEGLIHPLLAEPVPNSGHIDNDAIITGSNASGKSTFIKTLAVNHILAQTLHTCTAERYVLCPSYVCSSMALKDDILAGESYFVAEIKSLRRIIAYASERRCLCLIDEILRGTNTPERIAASTAVLRALHETSSLCLIASHDLELTEILKDRYDNYHFRETFEDGEITFDYRLKDGPSTTTNAIKLLRHMGFEPGIVEEASRLVQSRESGSGGV